MADLSDVSTALVTVAAQAIYPNGTGQQSIAGTGVRIYPGWPSPQQLDQDLAAGICHVSVFPRIEERNTTRYPKDWQTLAVNIPTLTVITGSLMNGGQTVTVSGTVPTASNPTNVMVEANGKPYVYAVQPTDTLTGIATALATLVSADVPGTSNTGPVVTLPANANITAARVGITGTNVRETRRQERLFQLTIWADTPQHRDAIAPAIDLVLADTPFVTLADQSAARLIYKGSPVSDEFQKDKLYRRDLLYTVEYATTETTVATQITQETINVINADSNLTIATINL